MRTLACLVLTLLALALPARAADPFHSGKPSETAAAVAAPTFGGRLVAAAAKAQRQLNSAISERFDRVGATGSSTALAGILLLSFAYGVLHAAGPGHGKMVVAAYFVGRRERWVKSILFGSLISLTQGVTAILIVGALALALRLAQADVLGNAAIVETASYALIALLGLWMLWQAIAGHGHGDEGRNHDGHDHSHGHHHHAPPAGRDAGPLLIVTAGLTPCASAIIVLLFALANSVFLVGVGAAMAMSAGMAITVSAIALLSVLARDLAQRLFGGSPRWALRLERGLAILGPVLLVACSALLFLGAWSQL
jgi:ABC-type nickel/cobalt efflux system permease component RcnA